MKYFFFIAVITQLLGYHVYNKKQKLSRKDIVKINALAENDKLDSIIINPPYMAEPTSGSSRGNYISIQTFYATDRNLNSKNARPSFSIERSTVRYGVCDVSIPITHKMESTESTSIFKLDGMV